MYVNCELLGACRARYSQLLSCVHIHLPLDLSGKLLGGSTLIQCIKIMYLNIEIYVNCKPLGVHRAWDSQPLSPEMGLSLLPQIEIIERHWGGSSGFKSWIYFGIQARHCLCMLPQFPYMCNGDQGTERLGAARRQLMWVR